MARRSPAQRHRRKAPAMRRTPRELPSPLRGGAGGGGDSKNVRGFTPPGAYAPTLPARGGVSAVQVSALQDTIDVPGVGRVRQGGDVGGHVGLGDPAVEGQAPGFRPAPRRSRRARARLADRGRRSATSRWIVVNSKESAGSGRDRPASTAVLEALHVDLGEGRLRRARRSAHRGSCRAPRSAASHTWPSQPPAPSAAATNSAEAVETVGLAELIAQRQRAGALAAGRLDQRHAVVAGVDRPDRARAQRLRLQRHHPRAEAAEAADAVADVGCRCRRRDRPARRKRA